MGPERRSVFVVLGATFLTVGSLLWVSLQPNGWIPGLVLMLFGTLIFTSLLTGKPIGSLHADVQSGAMDGVPLIAPLWYQVDQLRQTVPQFHGLDFDIQMLWSLLPKTTRSRQIPLYEPLAGPSMQSALDYLASTGELTREGNAYRAANAPSRLVRWKHGKDAKD